MRVLFLHSRRKLLVKGLLIILWGGCGPGKGQQAPYNPYSGQTSGYNPYGTSVIYAPPIIPVEPETIDECSALQSSYQKAVSDLVTEHQKCLDTSPETSHTPTGGPEECSKNSCQPLHNQMYAAQQDASRINNAFNACVSAVESIQKRQQDLNAAQQGANSGQGQQPSQHQAVAPEASVDRDRYQRQADADARRMDAAQTLRDMDEKELERRTAERTKQLDAVEQQKDAVTSGSHESDYAQEQIAQLDQKVLENNQNPLGTTAQAPPPAADDFVITSQSAAAVAAPEAEQFTVEHGPPGEVAVNESPHDFPNSQEASPPLGANMNDPNVAPPGPQAPQSQLSSIYEPKTSVKFPLTYGYTIAHYQCTGELRGRPQYVDLVTDTYSVCREDFKDVSDPQIFSGAMDAQGFAQLQAVKQVCGEEYNYIRTGWYFDYEGRPEDARRTSAEQSRLQFIHDRQSASVKIISFPITGSYTRNCD